MPARAQTFYDFDTGMSQVEGAVPAVEIMQMGPQASAVLLPDVSEIAAQSEAAFASSLSSAAQAIAATMPGDWGTLVYSATVYGVYVARASNVSDSRSHFDS